MTEIINYVNGKVVQLHTTDFADNEITPNKSIFLEYLRDCIFQKDSNFILMCEGKSGSGKSVSCLGILEAWCNYIGIPFSIEKNVVFGAKDLMMILADLDNKKKQGIDIRGYPLLFDEAGISMDNREWHNHIHKIMNDTAEVFRYLNLVLFITAPSRSRIDVKLRDLAHATLQPKHIKKDQYSMCKLYLNDRSWDGKQELYIKLKASHKGWHFVIDSLKVKKPSAKVLFDYKKVMEQFKGNTIQVGYSKLQKRENMTGEAIRRPLTQRQRQIYMLHKSGNPNIAIATQLAITESSVGLHLRHIRAKGYDL